MEIKYDGKECDPRITRYSIKGLEGYSGHVLKHNGQFTDLDLVLNVEQFKNLKGNLKLLTTLWR